MNPARGNQSTRLKDPWRQGQGNRRADECSPWCGKLGHSKIYPRCLLNNNNEPFMFQEVPLSSCPLKTKLVFAKTHKTGSTTLQNIVLRFGDKHNLNFAFPPDEKTEDSFRLPPLPPPRLLQPSNSSSFSSSNNSSNSSSNSSYNRLQSSSRKRSYS